MIGKVTFECDAYDLSINTIINLFFNLHFAKFVNVVLCLFIFIQVLIIVTKI